MSHDLSDVGAERAVLAGLFRHGIDVYVEVSDIIDHSTFFHHNNQVLYKCVESAIQANREIDLPSILSAASQLNFSELVNSRQELSYIKSLFDFPVKKENVLDFAVQIKKFEFARSIKDLTNKISSDVGGIDGSETIDAIVSMVETPLMDFLREDDGGERPEKIGNNIEEYVTFLSENQCDIVGVPTGFPRFDQAIGGGLRRKCVDLIAARPKVGKSAFADNVAIHVASQGIPVLMLDTEMSKDDHLNRILANLSKVSISDISCGQFIDNDEKLSQVDKAAKKISSIPYSYVSVAGKPFEQVLNIIKRWIMQEVGTDENGNTNDCLIVYDYLKLMSSSSITNNIQEYQALGFQITSLHNTCVKLDVPCLAFVQLNRDGITKESTDTVSGSDRLIWLCTSFTIFKNKSPEELAEDGLGAGNRKLVPVVARHGGGLDDGDYINMNIIGDKFIITELKTRNEFRKSPDGDTGLVDNLDELDLGEEDDVED